MNVFFFYFQGLCHKIAEEQGIRHGQLPLDKYINMKTRKVLTIDHGNYFLYDTTHKLLN